MNYKHQELQEVKMKTFYEFTQQMQNQMPPVGDQKNIGNQPQQNEDPIEFENLRNDLQKIEMKLKNALSRGTISNQKAGLLIQSLIKLIQDSTNLSNAATMKYVKQGMQTNTEPAGSPPMQPQAMG